MRSMPGCCVQYLVGVCNTRWLCSIHRECVKYLVGILNILLMCLGPGSNSEKENKKTQEENLRSNLIDVDLETLIKKR